MLLPLLGCMSTFGMFAVIGVIVLRLMGVLRMWPLVFPAFMVAAFVGFVAYGSLYSALFADSRNQLQSTAAVLGLLIGMPVAGTLAGWGAARAMASWISPRHDEQHLR